MLINSGMIRGDLFGTEKQFDKFKQKSGQKTAAAPAAAPSRPAYSEHTPSIWADRTKSGQRVFSNRGSETKNDNEKGQKNDAKTTKKDV